MVKLSHPRNPNQTTTEYLLTAGILFNLPNITSKKFNIQDHTQSQFNKIKSDDCKIADYCEISCKDNKGI
jgi:hypothetical protein